MPEILWPRPIEKTAFLLMTSDKGLAGSFNGAVIREFERYIRENHIDLQRSEIFLHRHRPEIKDISGAARRRM